MIAKVRQQTKARTARRANGPQTLETYIEALYLADPGLRRRVNARLREMLREQAAARRKRQKTRRARKARAR